MRKQKPQQEVSTFTEIGGSPVPGFTLRHVLRGHTSWIGRIAWSPDGSYLASPSEDETIRIWDTRSGACVRIFELTDAVISVAWSPDSKCLASSSANTIHLWDFKRHLQTLEEHSARIYSVAWYLTVSSLRRLQTIKLSVCGTL